MGERNQEPAASDPTADLFAPSMDELSDDEFDELIPKSVHRQFQAEKRRRVEQRLEEKRMRDELGYYDVNLDDF